MVYKIIKKSNIPEPTRFSFTQFALGDTSKDFAVTDEETTCIFYIGTEHNCKKYVKMSEEHKTNDLTILTSQEIDNKKNFFINSIKEGCDSSETASQLEDLLSIFRKKT